MAKDAIAVQITSQGILIPNAAVDDWGEVEVIKEAHRIVIQPKSPPCTTERETDARTLRDAGLLYAPLTEPETPFVPVEHTPRHAKQLPPRLIAEMKTAGLIEDLSWPRLPETPPEERASLAKKLSYGKPLSEIIIENRGSRA